MFEKFGQEMINLFMGTLHVIEDVKDSVEETGRQAEDLIEEAVDNVNDFVSDTLGTVAGWFS